MDKLKATIDRFEDQKAVLIFPDGQELIIDRDQLGSNLKAGDVIHINFIYDQKETQAQENLAKNILQEILKKKDV